MKYLFRKYILFSLTFLLKCLIINAQITGSVYLDANMNGKKEANSAIEKALVGTRISAYDAQNQLIGSTQSAEDGTYRLDVPQYQRVKLVYSNFGIEWEATSSTVQFVESPKEVHFGLMKKQLFVGEKPMFISSIFMNGQPHPDLLDYQSPVLVYFRPDATYNQEQFKKDKKRDLAVVAKVSDVGSIWGLAYNPLSQTLFSAAFLKRHAGLGILGIDGIYQTDINTKITNPFLKLSDWGIDVGQSPQKKLLSKAVSASIDADTYSKIGKIGIGGIDWSEDGRIFYFVNLFDQKLYALTFKVKENSFEKDSRGYGIVEKIDKFSLPSDKVLGGINRPFSVKCVYDDVYIGAVFSGEVSQRIEDLRGMVYKLSNSKGDFSKILDISLDYPRGKALKSSSFSKWNPWSDDFKDVQSLQQNGTVIYPQPIISDIEFDNDGNMILALMDRFGHQVGTGQPAPDGTGSYIGVASGDILKAYRKKKDIFLLEQNSIVGKNGESEGKNNEQGPANGEFYFQESFAAEGKIIHEENGSGSIAYNPQSNEILYAVHEPIDEEFNNSGVKWLDNSTGKSKKGLPFFKDSEIGTFSKVNAIGDIEMITETLPIIASNRIWMDCNENGIQEADELPMANIPVELWHDKEKITTVISDEQGKYTFERLNPNTEYIAKIKLQSEQTDKQAFTKLVLTKLNVGDVLFDNDAITEGEYASIRIKTQAPGNHIFNQDFGFICIDKPNSKLNWNCKTVSDGKIEVTLSVTESKENERFTIQQGKQFTGISQFKTATIIPKNESIFKTIIDTESKINYTLRTITSSECFQDFSIIVSTQSCLNSLSDNDLSKQLIVFPNPTIDKVSFNYTSIAESNNITVSIVDIQGRTLQKTDFNAQNSVFFGTFDVNTFTSGTYFLSISDNGRKVSRGFTKQ